MYNTLYTSSFDMELSISKYTSAAECCRTSEHLKIRLVIMLATNFDFPSCLIISMHFVLLLSTIALSLSTSARDNISSLGKRKKSEQSVSEVEPVTTTTSPKPSAFYDSSDDWSTSTEDIFEMAAEPVTTSVEPRQVQVIVHDRGFSILNLIRNIFRNV
jgi:hypothetical protein